MPNGDHKLIKLPKLQIERLKEMATGLGWTQVQLLASMVDSAYAKWRLRQPATKEQNNGK